MTYYPDLVPPLGDDEIVDVVDDLAILHDKFDTDWEQWATERDAHEAAMLGQLAIIRAASPSQTLKFQPSRIRRTRAEIDLQIPPEFSEVYRSAGKAALSREMAEPESKEQQIDA